MGCCGGDASGIEARLRKISIYGYALIGLIVVIAGFSVFEHRALLAPYSTYIVLALFVGLHRVMHLGGRRSHGEPGGEDCGRCRQEGDGTPEPGRMRIAMRPEESTGDLSKHHVPIYSDVLDPLSG